MNHKPVDRRVQRLLLLVVPALLALLAGRDVAPVSAAFPGANGKIVYTRGVLNAAGEARGYDLWIMNADGTQPERLVDVSVYDQDPALSPDSSLVAFSSWDGGNAYGLYIINVDGSGLRRLTNNDGTTTADGWPAWSPDATQLVFRRDTPGDAGAIYKINADGSGLTRLTEPGSVNDTPVWSPKGDKIAFISLREGGNHLFVMDAQGNSENRVNTPTAFQESNPDWSPDGEELVFKGDLGFYRIKPNGTGEAFIDAWGFVPVWSPDGQKLLYYAYPDDADIVDLYSVSVGGGEPQKLTSATPTVRHLAADWQPIPANAITINVVVVGAPLAAPGQILGPSGPVYSPPAGGGLRHFPGLTPGNYTLVTDFPNSHTLSLACDKGVNGQDATRVSLTLAAGQHITCTFTLTQNGRITILQKLEDTTPPPPEPWQFNGSLGNFTIRPAGTDGIDPKRFPNLEPNKSYTITQADKGAYIQRVTCDNDAAGQRDKPTVTFTLGVGEVVVCTFTAKRMPANKDMIVFSSNRDGDADIYVIDPAARDLAPRQLTNAAGDDTDPTLSPDGSFIAFTSERDGNPEIYIMDYDGTQLMRMTHSSATIQRRPAISADGTEIAYESTATGNGDIYTMPIASRVPVRVTDNPAADSDPTWVPGIQRRLVYVSERDGNPEIYTSIAIAGAQVGRITVNPAVDYAPTISRVPGAPVAGPCAASSVFCLAFTSLRAGRPQVYAMPVTPDGRMATVEPVQLTNSSGVNFALDWSLDGSQITFSSTRDGNPELYTMRPDGADQTRLTDDPAGDGEADPAPLSRGTITIRAVVIGAPPAAGWAFGGDLGAFTLPAGGGEVSFGDRPAGTYWVTGTSVAGFSHSVVCGNGATGADAVVLTLDPAQWVTCTFTYVAEGATPIHRLFTPLAVR